MLVSTVWEGLITPHPWAVIRVTFVLQEHSVSKEAATMNPAQTVGRATELGHCFKLKSCYNEISCQEVALTNAEGERERRFG